LLPPSNAAAIHRSQPFRASITGLTPLIRQLMIAGLPQVTNVPPARRPWQPDRAQVFAVVNAGWLVPISAADGRTGVVSRPAADPARMVFGWWPGPACKIVEAPLACVDAGDSVVLLPAQGASANVQPCYLAVTPSLSRRRLLFPGPRSWEMETRMQQLTDGRHRVQHSRDDRNIRRASGPAAPRRAMPVRYRWLASFALAFALPGSVFAYRSQNQPAALASPGARPVPLLGSSVQNKADLARDTANFGRMPIVRVYYPGLPSPDAWTTGLAAANHSAVIVSFKARPTSILSGADNAALRHFFDTAPKGHPIYYCYFHEPEDNIEAGQFKLAAYKAAWARVVAIAAAAHNPYLHSTLILMSWDLVRASHRNWRNYLPGGGIISTLGWDAYPVGSATNEHPQLTPATAFMGPAIAASKSVGLPYGFPEFGLSRASGRTGWLAAVARYIMHSGALFASYFNGNRQYPTLRLTDRSSIAVWRGFVAASRSGQRAPKPTPSGSPSPSPTNHGRPAGLHITGLLLNPSAISRGSQANAVLTVRLSQQADITVCVLSRNGTIMRTIASPGRRAGLARIWYLGRDSRGHQLPAGHYTVLAVAANANGSAAASARLTVSLP